MLIFQNWELDYCKYHNRKREDVIRLYEQKVIRKSPQINRHKQHVCSQTHSIQNVRRLLIIPISICHNLYNPNRREQNKHQPFTKNNIIDKNQHKESAQISTTNFLVFPFVLSLRVVKVVHWLNGQLLLLNVTNNAKLDADRADHGELNEDGEVSEKHA